ncbi:MarR family transcriptional regulator [Mycobacterium sp. OTB74]|jgi:DNA-binding MarR family transcriptional regulator|uniref:MarR family winged helix-turn-helix transcriptional regulator n=1 Tax=Mycobacterium sp. OTB74 TaxID=1853452 RepID=UPI002473EA79|nr:MarR family transcriptional regulator [Mycobacterium sp. OTB74]MDH6247735.1 DNA-binding MarR family transcriptional regulator [Mycobacterium sp. OTB74]
MDAATDLTMRYLADRDGLSSTASQVLNRVHRQGPMRLTTLAVLEGTSQPSMTQLVKRLESQELLQRLSDPGDGRAALVGLTEAGRELLARRTAGRRKRLDHLLATLSSDEQAALQLAAHVSGPILKRLFEIASQDSSHGGVE